MFSVLLLLVFVQGLYGLSCFDAASSFRTSRKNFDWKGFTAEGTDVKFEVDPWDDDKVCRVTITVGYDVREGDFVDVVYGAAAKDACDYVEFGTTFMQHNDQESIVSYIDYVCSSHDFCEFTFVNKWIGKLFGSETNSLHASVEYLLSNSSDLKKCDWNQATADCESHLCFAIYDELKNIPFKARTCPENRPAGSIYIYVTTKLLGTGKNPAVEHNYKCRKNKLTQELSYDFKDHQHFIENKQRHPCSQQSWTSVPTNIRSANFTHTLDDLDQAMQPLEDNINECEIYLEADYRQQDGHVTINYDVPEKKTQTKKSFDMILSIENGAPFIWSRMYYTCVSSYSCDRRFAKRWIRWLAAINNQSKLLESRILSKGDYESYKCDIWGHILDSTADICFSYTYKRRAVVDSPKENTNETVSTDGQNPAGAVEPFSSQHSCSRLFDRKNDVYKYVLTEILQQCVPKEGDTPSNH